MKTLHNFVNNDTQIMLEGGSQAILCSNIVSFCDTPSGFINNDNHENEIDYLAEVLVESFFGYKKSLCKTLNEP